MRTRNARKGLITVALLVPLLGVMALSAVICSKPPPQSPDIPSKPRSQPPPSGNLEQLYALLDAHPDGELARYVSAALKDTSVAVTFRSFYKESDIAINPGGATLMLAQATGPALLLVDPLIFNRSVIDDSTAYRAIEYAGEQLKRKRDGSALQDRVAEQLALIVAECDFTISHGYYFVYPDWCATYQKYGEDGVYSVLVKDFPGGTK